MQKTSESFILSDIRIHDLNDQITNDLQNQFQSASADKNLHFASKMYDMNIEDAVLVKDLFLTKALKPWRHVNECNI